jgi:soluble lytic murein transglycosylase-like protein
MKHSKLFLGATNHLQHAAAVAIGVCFLFELTTALVAAGQSSRRMPNGNNVKSMAETALAQQQAAVAAMAESLAKQREAVHHQIESNTLSGFFQLPPPGRVPPSPQRTACDPLPEEELGPLIEQAARRETLSPGLLRGVIRQESGFKPCAVSPKGAMGLMQLMPETASQFHVLDPFNAEGNVNAGAKLLKQLLERYNGSLEKALSAYNAGTARVDAIDGVPDIPETIDYVRNILQALPIVK